MTGQVFFGRITHGAEQLAWQDIQKHCGAELLHIHHRTVVFRSPADPRELLSLRSLEDLFVHAATLRNVGRTRAALGSVQDAASKLSFQEPLWSVNQARQLPGSIRFTITASFVGKRNYNRWEIADAIKSGLLNKHAWEYLETRDEPFRPHELHLRAVLEDDFMLLGLRLGERPLGERSYKKSHLPGSLNPPLAYLMAASAAVPPGGVLLDPMCGAGTIPIEAALNRKDITVIGGDQSEEAIEACSANLGRTASNVSFRRLNAASLDLPDAFVSGVVSDLPWGRQTELQGADEHGYIAVLQELTRVLRPGGSMVLLTEQTEMLMKAILSLPLQVAAAFPLSLYGRHPTLHVLKKAGTGSSGSPT